MSKPDTLLVADSNGEHLTTIPGDTPEQVIESRGWHVIKDDLAVSRPRKKRTKADMQRLIKEGIVADPAVGVPERVRSDNEYIVDVPTATAIGKKE